MKKKWIIGIKYWLLTCFLGSIFIVEIERQNLNDTGAFHLPFNESIILWMIFFFASALISSPIIGYIYYAIKKGKSPIKSISLTFLVSFLIIYYMTYQLTKSYYETLYIVGLYFLIGSIFSFFYLKKLKQN